MDPFGGRPLSGAQGNGNVGTSGSNTIGRMTQQSQQRQQQQQQQQQQQKPSQPPSRQQREVTPSPPPTPPAPVDNPFEAHEVIPPPYRPPVNTPPYNKYEIPMLPTSFEASFVWNKGLRGRWVYDYPTRRSLVEYYLRPKGVRGFLYEYGADKLRVTFWETGGGMNGERCAQFDLVSPFHKMFKPESWRRTDVVDVDIEGASIYEAERENQVVKVSSVWNNMPLTLHAFVNGTFLKISIRADEWAFDRFVDMTAWDNYRLRHSPALNAALNVPPMPCAYSGPLDLYYSDMFQHSTPWTLVKPTIASSPKSASNEEEADAKEAKAGARAKKAKKDLDAALEKR